MISIWAARTALAITGLYLLSGCGNDSEHSRDLRPASGQCWAERPPSTRVLDASITAYAIVYRLTDSRWTIDWVPICQEGVQDKGTLPFSVAYYAHSGLNDASISKINASNYGELVSNQVFPIPLSKSIASVYKVHAKGDIGIDRRGQISLESIEILTSEHAGSKEFGEGLYKYQR